MSRGRNDGGQQHKPTAAPQDATGSNPTDADNTADTEGRESKPTKHQVLTTKFPKASALLDKLPSAASLAKAPDTIYFIDTNVLLLPYNLLADGKDISTMLAVFRKLSKDGRLYVAGHVLRELVNRRPELITTIWNKLNGLYERLAKLTTTEFPPLPGIDEDKASERREQLEEVRKSTMAHLDKLRLELKTWENDDPILRDYRTFFATNRIIECKGLQTPEGIKLALMDAMQRKEWSRGPGYKDFTESGGLPGDLVIWMTMIEYAKDKSNVVFVMHDDKADWVEKFSDRKHLRFDLAHEFHNATNRHIAVMSFSDLLLIVGEDKSKTQAAEDIKRIEGIPNALDDRLYDTHITRTPASDRQHFATTHWEVTLSHSRDVITAAREVLSYIQLLRPAVVANIKAGVFHHNITILYEKFTTLLAWLPKVHTAAIRYADMIHDANKMVSANSVHQGGPLFTEAIRIIQANLDSIEVLCTAFAGRD